VRSRARFWDIILYLPWFQTSNRGCSEGDSIPSISFTCRSCGKDPFEHWGSRNHAKNCSCQDRRQTLPYRITEELPVILPQWATANRERQGALTESRTTIAGDPFYREWLCGAGQGCRGRILERLYIDNCLPLTVELFRQLAFFILSCKPISYCRFKRIDVYIL
jgi:uncharacterized protein YbaR (Trm112 family)